MSTPIEINSRPPQPRFVAKAVLSNSPLKIVQNLHSIVQAWAEEQGLINVPGNVTEDQLFQAILDCEIMGDLPSSTLIGVSSCIVVKLAPLSAIRHLPTFEHIGLNASRIQEADHLGVLVAESRVSVFMQIVSGVLLDRLWTSLNQHQRTSIMQQLEETFRLLRAIARPNSIYPLGIGSPAVCSKVR